MIFTLTLPLLGYLLGSIPTGVLLGRLVGRDPRTAGSRNIGASNVTRTLGRKLGALTLLIDLLKGALPTYLALRLGDVGLAALVGGLAVVGHCFPVWLRFRGGKGVATTLGVMVVFSPGMVAVAALIWIACLLFTRIPTIGSLAAMVAFVILARSHGLPFEVQLLTLALFGLVLVRHAGNLRVLKTRYLEQQARRSRRNKRAPRRRR